MFVCDFFFPLMQLTPDEEQRRKLRRERNKVAASKCRMKRKEHVNALRKVGVRLCSFSDEISSFLFSQTFLMLSKLK